MINYNTGYSSGTPQSPGVYTSSTSFQRAVLNDVAVRGVFAGNFSKGPTQPIAITSEEELVEVFGTPNDSNYNDWYQARNFLQYYPGLYIARVVNSNHSFDKIGAKFGSSITATKDNPITNLETNTSNQYRFDEASLAKIAALPQYTRFTISGDNADNNAIYTIVNTSGPIITPALKHSVFEGDEILVMNGVTNASIEMPTKKQFASTATTTTNGGPANEAFIESPEAFNLYNHEYLSNNIATPLTIWARSAGSSGNNIQVALAYPSDFVVNYSASDATEAKLAFNGVVVDKVVTNVPTGNQITVLVAEGGKVKETFIVTDSSLEEIVNKRSKFIFVKRGTGELYSTCFNSKNVSRPLALVGGIDAQITSSDIQDALEPFESEMYKFDVVVGNELDNGFSAIHLAMNKGNVQAIVGASLNNFGCKSSALITDSLVDFVNNIYVVDGCCKSFKDGEVDTSALKVFTSRHASYFGNYLSVYDSYNKKQRLVNIAGDIAGLRAKSTQEHGCHSASAGIQRGVITTGSLVFNPKLEHQNILYTNKVNPVIIKNGVPVVWGNRTLAPLTDSFSSLHVSNMTNIILRSAQDYLNNFVFNSINHFTFTSVKAGLIPMLDRLAGEGFAEPARVVCGPENNSPETSSQNILNVAIYIRPVGVAEFICLNLTNVGNVNIERFIKRESY